MKSVRVEIDKLNIVNLPSKRAQIPARERERD